MVLFALYFVRWPGAVILYNARVPELQPMVIAHSRIKQNRHGDEGNEMGNISYSHPRCNETRYKMKSELLVSERRAWDKWAVSGLYHHPEAERRLL